VIVFYYYYRKITRVTDDAATAVITGQGPPKCAPRVGCVNGGLNEKKHNNNNITNLLCIDNIDIASQNRHKKIDLPKFGKVPFCLHFPNFFFFKSYKYCYHIK